MYVAAEDQNEIGNELLNDLVTTFDEQILPVAARSFGLAHDIDRDGRFTVLLSSWLSRLGNGRHAVNGFVRVTDLDPLYSAPFGNRCDMMYLSTELRPGPHLRTIMAHEYMHAVVFSRKSHPGSGLACTPVEEEGWLDEALAHLAEDVHGFSRSNIDYRVKAFLCQPEQYQLVVEDYYAADLFRSRGHRGATYLFLRWCVSQYGPNLIPALVGSKLRGIANLEDATGCSFAELYRRWSVALCQAEHEHESTVVAPRQTRGDQPNETRTHAEDWQLAGPRKVCLTSGRTVDEFRVAGTSSHFAVVRSNSAGNVEITVRGPSEAMLQVTVIPGSADSAKLELSAQRSQRPGRRSSGPSKGSPDRGKACSTHVAWVGAACSRRWRVPYSGRPIRGARSAWNRLQFWNRRLVRGRRSPCRDQSASRVYMAAPGRWSSD